MPHHIKHLAIKHMYGKGVHILQRHTSYHQGPHKALAKHHLKSAVHHMQGGSRARDNDLEGVDAGFRNMDLEPMSGQGAKRHVKKSYKSLKFRI